MAGSFSYLAAQHLKCNDITTGTIAATTATITNLSLTNVTVDDLTVNNDLTVGDNVGIGGNVTVDGNVTADGNIICNDIWTKTAYQLRATIVANTSISAATLFGVDTISDYQGFIFGQSNIDALQTITLTLPTATDIRDHLSSEFGIGLALGMAWQWGLQTRYADGGGQFRVTIVVAGQPDVIISTAPNGNSTVSKTYQGFIIQCSVVSPPQFLVYLL